MGGVGGGVGVRDGEKGVGVCRMKACSVLLGVKGIIMQTMGKNFGRIHAKEISRKERQ